MRPRPRPLVVVESISEVRERRRDKKKREYSVFGGILISMFRNLSLRVAELPVTWPLSVFLLADCLLTNVS